MKSLTYTVEINCSHDIYDGSDLAEIVITRKTLNYIRAAQKQLKALDATSITRWDSPNKFLKTDYDDDDKLKVDEETIIDLSENVVTNQSFYFIGCVKNTDMQWSTNWLDTKELFECWKALTISKNKIPLMILKTKNEKAKDILSKRLTEE